MFDKLKKFREDYTFLGYVQTRRDVLTPPRLTAPMRNVRPITQAPPHEAPEPIRQGSETPSRPSRQQIVALFNSRDIQSVMEDSFDFDLLAPAYVADTLHGPQLAWQERANIVRGNPTAYGSLFEIIPEQYDPSGAYAGAY